MRLRIIAAALLALAGCSPKTETKTATIPPPEAVVEPAPPALDAPAPSVDLSTFLGKWNGPEGTSLTIGADEGAANAVPAQYRVTLINLDGPRQFVGTQKADGIAITRDGAELVIHKGSGDETGMKWLAGKKDCLVVAANEGYCKD